MFKPTDYKCKDNNITTEGTLTGTLFDDLNNPDEDDYMDRDSDYDFMNVDIPRNKCLPSEIALDNIEDAFKVTEILIKNDYIVMISKEEDLYIINYIWMDECDRNGVIFVER